MSKLKKSFIPIYGFKENKKLLSPRIEECKKSLIPIYNNNHMKETVSQKLHSPRCINKDNTKSLIPRYQGKKVSKADEKTISVFFSVYKNHLTPTDCPTATEHLENM